MRTHKGWVDLGIFRKLCDSNRAFDGRQHVEYFGFNANASKGEL